jgi:ferredoxin
LSEHAGDCEAPCSRTCPCGLDIPRMLRLISSGNLRKALLCVKETMALPEILGTICPAPCEKVCRRKQVDSTINIRYLHRIVAEINRTSGTLCTPECAPDTGRKVACIGAGPAGLSAVYYLSVKGHKCTLFDLHSEAGGTLRYGIAHDVLPPSLIEHEAALLNEMGVTFRLDTKVGSTLPLKTVIDEFDAVILATGNRAASIFDRNTVIVGKETISIDKKTLMTDIPGVFACGGVVIPGKMAARSVGQGRMVANMVDVYLRGGVVGPLQTKPQFDAHIGKVTEDEFNELVKSINNRKDDSVAQRQDNDLTADALRCLQCDCGKKNSCALRATADRVGIRRQPFRLGKRREITRAYFDNGVVYESGKCILCGRCVALTKRESIGLTFISRGFNVTMRAPFGMTIPEAAGGSIDRCVALCPTGALWKRENDRERYTTIQAIVNG